MRVVIIDGSHMAYRAQYTAGYLQTQEGFKTGVIHSFLSIFNKIHKHFDYPPMLICWEGGYLHFKEKDHGGDYKVVRQVVPLWRKSYNKDYKANRDQITPDKIAVHNQIPLVQKMCAYLRHPQFSVPGLECDDLIGILAKRLESVIKIKEVAIISTDKDFFQCISDVVKVYRPRKGQLVKYTSESLKKEYGVYPDRWVDYKSLVGDSGDNYDGIPGVGPATAVKLLDLGALPKYDWEDQPKIIKKEYAKLEDLWKKANEAYIMAKIPTSVKHKYFASDLKDTLTSTLNGFEVRLERIFTKEELKASITLFEKFCSKYELHEHLSKKRIYFTGALVDGERLYV